jgi:hypothetical protein
MRRSRHGSDDDVAIARDRLLALKPHLADHAMKTD